MKESSFEVPKMDCPSEERMIRLALDSKPEVKKLGFNLSSRTLSVFHDGEPSTILSAIEPLGLGAKLSQSRNLSEEEETVVLAVSRENDQAELSVLKIVLFINAAMFVVELLAALFAQSAGLMSDSLDNFADAAVFALSIYAVGKTVSHKKRAARMSGYLQLMLALIAFGEVIRKFVFGSEPEAPLMIGIAAVALVANAFCMRILAKHREGEVHMRASWIFLTNDILANLGVIVAGVLIRVTGSHLPDLITGALIAGIVLLGSMRILRAAK